MSKDPIKWELLHNYLRSLPTRVRLTDNHESVKIEKNYNSKLNYYKVLANELHNLIDRAVIAVVILCLIAKPMNF